MRGGILTIGIILLIFGIFLYFSGNNMVQQVEAYDVEGIPISEILKLDSGVRAKYDAGKSLVMFGSIFGIVGFILCIAGIAAPRKKPEVIVQKKVTQKDRHCPNCGRSIPFDAKVCPYCGKKFEEFL